MSDVYDVFICSKCGGYLTHCGTALFCPICTLLYQNWNDAGSIITNGEIE